MRALVVACALAIVLFVSMANALQMHERVKRPPRPSSGLLRKRVTPIEELLPGGVLPDSIPSKVDWRKGEYIPKVKDSGMCAGIEEADPETTAMAAQVAIANHKKVVPLSDQELVDCVYGCQGGLMHDGMEWLIKNTNGTIVTAATYVSGNGTNKCNPYQGAVGAQVKAVHTLSKQDSTLAHAVALLGPVVVGVDAMPWQLYTGGILSYDMCKCQQIDHTAAIVGYNLEGSKPYWIVRNSWGESWGEDGYAYLAYGNNTCCIRDDAIVPEMYL